MNESNVKIAGQDTSSLAEFIREHNVTKDGLRLGQRFVNIYIKHSWPELFYERSEKRCLELINRWLTEYQYTDTMPPLANIEV